MEKPLQVFCCYAREDEEHLKNLKRHLSALQRQRLIDVWDDGDISAGVQWDQEIKKRLNEAHIIVLLISPDFIDWKYGETEMKYAGERYKQGKARVISVFLRPITDWEKVSFGDTQLGQLQTLPKEGRPVTSWTNYDEAWKQVGDGIKEVVNELLMGGSVPSIQPRFSVSRRVALIVLGGITVGGMSGSSAVVLTRSQVKQTPSSLVTPGSLPGTTGIPSTPPVVSVPPGTVLYQADAQWLQWNRGGEWTLQNGLVISNGTNAEMNLIVAPYKPERLNYAVEAQIRYEKFLLDVKDYAYFDIRVGAGDYPLDGEGYTCNITSSGKAPIYLGGHNVNEGSYSLDHGWHLYRVEVRQNGIRFLVDGHLLTQTMNADPNALTGATGIEAVRTQISVRSFGVFALAG